MRAALTLLPFAAVGVVADVATLVTLTDYVAEGAVCLDGTPYEIWYAAASNPVNATKWVFDIQGGAWCESISDCASRAYNPSNCYLGSSSPACFNADGERCMNKTDAMTFECLPACNGARWCGGLFVNDSVTNPLTHDWNKVLLPYHDGGSFAGDNATVTYTTYGGKTVPLYFRGHRNFLAAIDYLVKHAGLNASTEVILTGNSAGGLATYYHMDELTELLPQARVVAAPDSGFFFADDPGDLGWPNALLWMVQQFDSLGGLDKSCVTARTAAGLDPAHCAFPEVSAPYLTTPLFVMNSRFDPALDSISCNENGENVTHVNEIGQHFASLVNSTLLSGSRNNGAFVTACHQHCGQWAQGVDGDFNVTIDGWQAVPALQEWMRGGRGYWLQSAEYPCADCCSGGQVPVSTPAEQAAEAA